MKDSKLTYGMTADERKTITGVLLREQIELSEGDILAREGEVTDTFYIVKSGKLAASHSHYDGNVSLIVMFEPEDIVGLDVVNSTSRKNPHDVIAASDAEVYEIDYNLVYDNMITEMLRKKLIRNIMRELANESIRKLYKIDVLYRKALRSRIAVFLCHMYEKSEDGGFDIGMDRESFSQYLGVNRSALSHELSLMRQEGIIEVRRSKFRVLDIAGLTEYTL
jgi:CRP-like cAMP-binding protein